MSSVYDAVIIGGGHNGLTSAAYLARGGKRVLVLEKRPIVGGASATEEFAPGYRNSSCSFVVGYLRPHIIADLELAKHGLKIKQVKHEFFALDQERSMLLTDDASHNAEEIARFSSRDNEGLAQMRAMLDPLNDFFGRRMLRPPPTSKGGWRDALEWLRIGLDLMRLSRAERYRLAQVMTQSAGSLLNRYLESDEAKLPYAFGAISGNMNDLDTPTTAYRLLHGQMCEVNGVQGAWGLPMGGMGAISDAICSSAVGHGAEVRTSAAVKRILIENGRAVGVELDNGEKVRAKAVLSNADPKRTFLDLIDAEHLKPEFRDDICAYRMESGTFRMNFALDELPDFTCRPGTAAGPQHEGMIYVLPSIDYIREAFNDTRAGNWSQSPIIEAVIPSIHDDSLAPAGKHVMSISARYFPRHLSNGRNWDDCRPEAEDCIIDTFSKYAPNFRSSIIAQQALSPLDLEREYGMTGGDIAHGQYELNQLFTMRPHPDAAGCTTPVDGLYICGAGTHPGGGVSGIPGYHAARLALRNL
ncbi:MAG TPA: NAD(P)/FAD-dependent oxidoreductase [Woeseiaceae bacterium]|nr:NAD(P)/FAD-dependent oxidoreductase [Woeseiaceae bacterium]